MSKIRQSLALTLVVLASASAFANGTEELRYSWRLKGGVRFLAGLMFPTNGVGNLRTSAPGTENMVHSELLITAPAGKQGGFYSYESDIEARSGKTLMTYSGYEWGKKSRSERTVLDYVKGLARIRKQTPEGVENRVKKLPGSGDQMRDVLTAIYYIRQNAHTITGPLQTNVYTDGKEYPVIIRPGASKNFLVSGKQTPATEYEIIDAPGGKKWQGGVKVWLTADARRLPVRIEIQQSVASLQLDLQTIAGPAVLVAEK